MHDYLLSTEVVRFAFVFGVAVSMLMYERRHLTTGSIVVPGYIASFIVYPLIILATFLNAFASYLIVNKLLRRWFLLYGRTRFTVLAMTSILIQTAMLKLTPSGPWLWESDIKLFVGVGYVVPALIAHDMGRQGIVKTTKSVLIAASIVAVPIAVALLLDLPGVNDLAPLQGTGTMAIDPAWIPVAVLLSAAASWGVAHNFGFRSGGFVGAAFIGMLLADPWQVAIAAVLAVITYLIVTKFLMTSMILFGRRKFSAMLLVSSALAWSLLWIGTEIVDVGAQRHLELGSLALTPLFIPGLLANDTQRTSPRRVLFGVTLATSFVVSATWWIQSLFEGLTLAPAWKAVALSSFAIIFWRQFVPTRSPVRAGEATTATGTEQLAVTPLGSAVAYGRAGFERWAAAHREAAESAEYWLAAVLGEQPGRTLAGDTGTTGSLASIAAPQQPSTERARMAAIQMLSSPAKLPETLDRVLTPQEPEIGPAPARHPSAGEFDTVAAGIAKTVGRPQPLPRSHPAAQRNGSTADSPASNLPPTVAQRPAAVVLPDGGPTNKISERPGAAIWAHTNAAPGARTDHDDEQEQRNHAHVFPG